MTNQIEPYSSKILDMLDFSGYLEYFHSINKNCNSDFEAWQKTESVFFEHFSIPKFSTYASFRAYKSRYYKKRKNRKYFS